MAEVAARGLLNSSFWCKALKVHQWEEKKAEKQKNDKLICKTAPPGINSFNFNKPSVSHSKDLLYGNEEWIITGSRKYTTCLVLITYRSLNEKINKETHSCNNLIARKHFWCGARERQKKPLRFQGECDTHLASVDNVVPVLAVVIHYIDVIQVGVCPVHQLLDHV